jgi:uncharacterized membrane protein (DUF373 family)
MDCNWNDPEQPANIACLTDLFGNIVQAIVMLAGVALFIMLLIGGFKYLTSSGDPKKTESARSTIFWALIGIVVMVSSYAIIMLIETFTGVKGLLNFQIPTF